VLARFMNVKHLHNSADVVLNTLLYLKRNFLTSLLANYGIPSIHVSSCFVKNHMWSNMLKKLKTMEMFFSYSFYSHFGALYVVLLCGVCVCVCVCVCVMSAAFVRNNL